MSILFLLVLQFHITILSWSHIIVNMVNNTLILQDCFGFVRDSNIFLKYAHYFE